MPHPELRESPNRLEIRSPMKVGMRVVLALIGLFPLIAPYELIIKIDWQTYLHPFFLFAALVSCGAIAVSALFFFAALAGISSVMSFDADTATFHHTSQAPIVRRTVAVYPLADVRGVEVAVQDWSDSGPTYHLSISMADGKVFESGASWARKDIESILQQVNKFLQRDIAPTPAP